MSKRYCITIILGCVVVYFLLVAFCLSESTQQRVADDPTLKGKGKDGACMDYAIALSSSEWIVDKRNPASAESRERGEPNAARFPARQRPVMPQLIWRSRTVSTISVIFELVG